VAIWKPEVLGAFSMLFLGKIDLVSIDVTAKYMPVAEVSLTFVHEDRENALDGKERALH
jgi:hypothetical protein